MIISLFLYNRFWRTSAHTSQLVDSRKVKMSPNLSRFHHMSASAGGRREIAFSPNFHIYIFLPTENLRSHISLLNNWFSVFWLLTFRVDFAEQEICWKVVEKREKTKGVMNENSFGILRLGSRWLTLRHNLKIWFIAIKLTIVSHPLQLSYHAQDSPVAVKISYLNHSDLALI